MRILIHGINFSPELTGIGKYTGEMAEWLAAQGHEVRVPTLSSFVFKDLLEAVLCMQASYILIKPREMTK